jgi:hypothetical protein
VTRRESAMSILTAKFAKDAKVGAAPVLANVACLTVES